ncbi:MAG: tetratricopeptide repeat protein [Myxococcota bacterium]
MRLTSLLLLLSLALGCPRGPSAEDTTRSRREFELAAAMHDEGNIPGAVGHLRQSIELDPENPEAYLLLGLIEYGRGNTADAETHARRGVELLVLQERQGATLAEARNVLGVILIDRGKSEEAREVLELSANDSMNTSPHLAWGNLGLAQLESGDPEGAIESLREAVTTQPRFCVGYHRLGRAYYELERWDEADQALVLAVEADEVCADLPALQNAWRLRAEVRAQLGRHSDAVGDLERCVALGPNTEDGRTCQRLLDGATATPDAK